MAKIFINSASKYDDLYNSVAYNEGDMASLLQNIHNKLDAQCNDCENIVTIDNVLNGINHVKSNSCNGYGLVYTDHFIHTPHKLHFFYLCYSPQLSITGIPGMVLILPHFNL